MLPARDIILAYLARAAGARRARQALLAALDAFVVLAGLLALGLLALRFAPVLRPWLLLALASVAAVGAAGCLAALLRRHGPGATARWIARRDAAFGGALADAVEFAGALDERRSPGGSPELAAAHVEQAGDRARADAAPERHARAGLRRLPVRAAAGALLAAGILAAALPGSRHLLLHGAPPSALDIVTYGDVELRLRYPAYLRLPERVETGTGDISAPVGTHVTIQLRADRPLRLARLDTPDGPVEMSVDGSAATARVVITRDGAWSAHLEGATGASDPAPPKHAIRALPDAPPEISLRMPGEDSVVLRPGEALEIAWAANDDHGLAEIVEVVALAGAETTPAAGGAASPDVDRQRLELLDPPVGSRAGHRVLSAWDLGLEPGKDVEVWIEARDDDEVSGPKWTASRRIRVSLGEHAGGGDETEAMTQLAGEQLLVALAGHLVSDPAAGLSTERLLESHEALVANVGEALSSLESVVTALQEEQGDLVAMSALEEMRGRLDWMLRVRQRRVSETGGAASALRAAAETLHGPEIEELERDVLFFDMWADRRASLRAVDSAQALLEAIARLQDTLATQQSAEMGAEAERSLGEVRSRVEALEPELDALADAAPDSERSREAREALEALRSALEREAAAQGRQDLPGAREVASQMERSAQELAQSIEDLARAGQVGDPELAAEMQRADAEIRRLRRQQADLRDRTNAAREDAEQALSAEDRARLDAAFAELIELAEQAVAAEAQGEKLLGESPSVAAAFAQIDERARIETRLGQLEDLVRSGEATADELKERQELREDHRDALRGRTDRVDDIESLMRLSQASRESLGRLRQVLADRNLDAARAPARWSLGALELLASEIERQDHDDLDAAAPPFATAAARASEILSRLDELERQIERATQSRMTDAQRQQMGELGQEQGELLGQARSLASRMREMSADAPFLDEQVGGALDEASEQMNQAASQLHGRSPGEASESQGEAMARLDEAAKAMSPSPSEQQGGKSGSGRRPQRGGSGERGRESRFGRFSREEVKIPDAEDYRVPKEFREEILAAMRSSSAPPGYEEQVREYYRRLVE